MAKRITYICSMCGSSDVLMDAWAEWDSEQQAWALHDTVTNSFCQRCHGETCLVEVELPVLTPA